LGFHNSITAMAMRRSRLIHNAARYILYYLHV